MSRAANTLTTSDVLTTPIKLKYSSSYDSSSYYGAGIRVLGGINNPITASRITPYQQRTLNYRSVRHLFYSNYLTGSFPVSASAALNWEQSTAASGTLDADIRNFPTGSGAQVKIISIPREIFGQKIARKGFQLIAQDGFSYYITDDGNGNLIDKASDDLYVDVDYFNPGESFTTGYVFGNSRDAQVGNIIYSQGIIIITNPEYYQILDAGPIVLDQVYTFFDTDDPKTFNPLSNAIPDSSPINTSSLALIPIQGQQFPSNIIVTGSVILSPVDPLYTTLGAYYTNYAVSSSIGTPSNIGNITVNIVPNCTFAVALDGYYYYGSPRLVYDFGNTLAYSNSGSTIRDLSGQDNSGSYTVGAGNGNVTSITTYNPNNPGFLTIPSSPLVGDSPSVRLPDFFKFTGNTQFTIVAWVNLQTLGFNGTSPGIVAAEGESGGFPIGWAFYYEGNAGVTLARYDGLGTTDLVRLDWTTMGYPAGPQYNRWVLLTAVYDGSDITVASFTPGAGTYVNNTAASTVSVTSDPSFSCFMGQRYAQFPQAFFGYLAIYDTALLPAELSEIFSATRTRYGV